MEKKTDIITSPRKFGVEFEIGCEDTHTLHNELGYDCQVTRDGSLTVRNPVEVITQPLSGPEGAAKIIKYCKIMEKAMATGSHPSCGMHVHLDGQDFLDKPQVTVVEEDGWKSFMRERGADVVKSLKLHKSVISLKYNSNLTKNYAAIGDRFLNGDNSILRAGGFSDKIVVPIGGEATELVAIPRIEYDFIIALARRNNHKKTGQAEPLSGDEITKMWKRMGELDTSPARYVAMLQSKEPVERLRQLMIFYLVFEDVILGMCSPSRRKHNSYCQPINESYSLDEVIAAKNYKTMKEIWYKTSTDINNRYNDSRYHSVNLHSLWGRTGTIELRCHGGTIKGDLTLLWIAFHQAIVDKAAKMELSDGAILEVKNSSLDVKAQRMLDVIDASPELRKYVAKLLNHFSGITI